MGGRKAVDITGVQFNNLIVLERDYDNSDKSHAYWKCQCQYCGKIKSIRGSKLRNGEVKSCPCVRPIRTKDLVGQHFGYWTVIERDIENILRGHSAYWKCKCACGNIKSVRGDTLLNGESISCGCKKGISKGEELILTILAQNNIIFETQKTFDNCRFLESNCLARFDFYLSEYNCLIEFDGKQHFQADENGWNTKENLYMTKERDAFKNEWCKENNILLIRIPYWHLNDLCIKDLLPETSQFILKE